MVQLIRLDDGFPLCGDTGAKSENCKMKSLRLQAEESGLAVHSVREHIIAAHNGHAIGEIAPIKKGRAGL